MNKVEITNLQNDLSIQENEIQKMVQFVLNDISDESIDGVLSVVFVDEDAMGQLNKTHLNHDGATDVISFHYEDNKNGEDNEVFGEVIVCPFVAKIECKRYHKSAMDELRLYVIHGILHLFGYDDQSEKEKLIMFQKQEELLENYKNLKV